MKSPYLYRYGEQITPVPKAPDGWSLTILPSPGLGIGDCEAILMHKIGKWTVRAVADTVEAAAHKVHALYQQKYEVRNV